MVKIQVAAQTRKEMRRNEIRACEVCLQGMHARSEERRNGLGKGERVSVGVLVVVSIISERSTDRNAG